MAFYLQSVTTKPVRLFRKKNHFSFENQIDSLAVYLVVGFLKKIDFQRRYESFADTAVQLLLLHSVSVR